MNRSMAATYLIGLSPALNNDDINVDFNSTSHETIVAFLPKAYNT
ncbi:hypothetical protein Ptr902_04159 [Pyrenophora tritici-repentis]|nr:hypothetical protein Ptr902_04159 [Pyrenophora tritici-repentis]